MELDSKLAKVKVDHLLIGNVRVAPTDVAKILGTWFDTITNLTTHINKTCNAAFYFLLNLRRIRKYPSRESAEILVHALVIGLIGKNRLL